MGLYAVTSSIFFHRLSLAYDQFKPDLLHNKYILTPYLLAPCHLDVLVLRDTEPCLVSEDTGV